jgi:hypothetical protein
MKATQMLSNRSGKALPNQLIITMDDGTECFQSYGLTIVMKKNGKVYLDEYYYDCSMTISRYRNQYLGCTTQDVKDRIKSGQYILQNLLLFLP